MTVYKIDNWALPKVKQFRTYIDVGAHDGDTSIPYVNKFKRVYAFEPNPETNKLIPNTIRTFPYALGDLEIEKVLTIPDNGYNDNMHGSVVRYTSGVRQYSVEQRTLDGFRFKEVDFIKIDVEGAEMDVVNGAVNTIINCKPVVMFENKKGRNDLVVDFFRKLSYNVKKYKSDWIAWYE